MQIINIATVNSFRKFTLTSGYDNENTKFVRVSDGYSVGADPLWLNSKEGGRHQHHIRGCGYLYGARKGYVMSTQKGGYQGWTDIVQLSSEIQEGVVTDDNGESCEYLNEVSHYVVFNPFENRKIKIIKSFNGLMISDGGSKDCIYIGKFATIFGEVEVHATPFKGLRNFMRLIRRLPEWATIHVNNVSYNESMTLKYDMGTVTVGVFDPLESFNLHTVEYCLVDRSNTLIKINGRYFSFQNEKYCQDGKFLNEQGVLTLTRAGSYYEGTIKIPANAEYETTEFQWNTYTAGKEILMGRAFLVYKPEETRSLHPVEEALLNLPQGECNDYTVMQYVKQSLGLGEATNGNMRDERYSVYRWRDVHPNVKAIYTALLVTARKSSTKASQMLCNLIHMNWQIDSLYKDYQFESDRLLDTFLHACMEKGRDMQKLWLDTIELQPQSMTDWINSNLVYWVEERHVGYHFSNNPAWAEKRNYQGNIKYIFAENASYANYKPVEVSEEEYGVYITRLSEERAYKARYDAIPNTVANKHLYIKQQDNPEQFPKATGKGELSGCVNMGSCQCGDVDWWVKYDCDTLEFSYGNSNWSNRSDHHIPYVGNALDMVVKATNITEGWKVIN